MRSPTPRAARNPLSSGIVARTLLRYGTEEQKAEWLPGIRSGEVHFSLGYSEPQAGSDLASLRCRAEARGDVYIVSGEKCWQSYAQDMDYLWLLCRTGSQESRGAGLTLLMVDMGAPGVTVAPLPTLDGDQLNEVRLEAVEVPIGHRVGPEDGAWTIMGEALADERHIQFPPGRVRRDLEEVVAWVGDQGLSREPLVRARLGELAVRVFEVGSAGPPGFGCDAARTARGSGGGGQQGPSYRGRPGDSACCSGSGRPRRRCWLTAGCNSSGARACGKRSGAGRPRSCAGSVARQALGLPSPR